MEKHLLHVRGLAEPLPLNQNDEMQLRQKLFDVDRRHEPFVWQDGSRKLVIPFENIVALESRPMSDLERLM